MRCRKCGKIRIEKVRRSLTEEVVFWQTTFLNEHYSSEEFSKFKMSFMEHILDYSELNEDLNKISVEIEVEKLAYDFLGGVEFSKYGMKISEGEMAKFRESIEQFYDQELIKSTVSFMQEVSKSSEDVKGKNIKNIFALFSGYSELIFEKHSQEEAWIDLEGLPLVTKVLLFTCLSKCKAWPRLMKTQRSKKAKKSKISYLSNWFKHFSKENENYIKSYQDIFLMTSKDIRNLRKRIWKMEADGDNPYFSIFDLAWENKLEEVKELLLKGLDVNSKNGKKGNTSLLHIAAERDNSELANMLETFNADANVRDRIGMTPLFYAVEHKNHRMIEKLISMGADVNAVDKFKSSVFYCAIYSSDVKSLEILKENGAHLDTMNKIKRTPLIKAAYLRKPDAVKWLLQFDVIKETMNHRDNRGRGAIHAACWGPKGGREGKKNGGKIILDSPESLELLLDAGADVSLL